MIKVISKCMCIGNTGLHAGTQLLHTGLNSQIPQCTSFISLNIPFWNWNRNVHMWYIVGYGTDAFHDDVIKWKHFPRYWPFVREIHRSPVNFPHKGQWRGALMFTLICVRINGWVNNHEAGDLRRNRAHCDVTVMFVICEIGVLTPLFRIPCTC